MKGTGLLAWPRRERVADKRCALIASAPCQGIGWSGWCLDRDLRASTFRPSSRVLRRPGGLRCENTRACPQTTRPTASRFPINHHIARKTQVRSSVSTSSVEISSPGAFYGAVFSGSSVLCVFSALTPLRRVLSSLRSPSRLGRGPLTPGRFASCPPAGRCSHGHSPCAEQLSPHYESSVRLWRRPRPRSYPLLLGVPR